MNGEEVPMANDKVKLLSVEDLMVLFRKKDRRAVWRLIDSQGLPHVHIGRSLYVFESDIRGFLEAKKKGVVRRGRPLGGKIA